MNTQQQIDEAKKLVEKLQREQNSCKHDFKEPIWDPEDGFRQEIRIGDFSQSHGSDYYPAFDMVPTKKDRWSRDCRICGKKEYTYENVQAVKGGPKFRN